jgi:hypothetical protein
MKAVSERRLSLNTFTASLQNRTLREWSLLARKKMVFLDMVLMKPPVLAT